MKSHILWVSKAMLGGRARKWPRPLIPLAFALLLALILVYLVMASLFESLLHPFVIMFTIPLAGIGAVLALLLTNTPVSVVVFIGGILLVGIVVNNAIVSGGPGESVSSAIWLWPSSTRWWPVQTSAFGPL